MVRSERRRNSDQPGYVQGRADGRPNVFLDTWGYDDETWVPSGAFAVFNGIGASKIPTIEREAGHAIAPEQCA